MRADLEKLLRDTTLVTLALAIGFGWSLYHLAQGIAQFIDTLTANVPKDEPLGYFEPGSSGGLTWRVGHRVLTLDGILQGLIELAVVATVAVLISRRARAASSD
jgi:hypothetical protein